MRKTNREIQKGQYAKFREAKEKVSLEQFGGKCWLCGKSYGWEGYHLHHIDYTNESLYERNSKALWTRRLRVAEATEHPERFRLLCPACHRLITGIGNYFVNRFEVLPKDLSIDKVFELAFLETVNRVKR